MNKKLVGITGMITIWLAYRFLFLGDFFQKLAALAEKYAAVLMDSLSRFAH